MEDLIVNSILLLLFLALAAVSLWVAVPNTVILLLQFFWPTVPATLKGESKRTVTQGKHTRYVRDHDTGEYEWDTRKGTTVSWEPRVQVHYAWKGQSFHKDNQDSWNHRMHYTEKSSGKAMQRFFAQRPYPVKVNPQRPGQLFLGLHQFPWLAVIVATLSSFLFLSVSVSTLFDMLPANLAQTNRFYWSVGGFCYGLSGCGFLLYCVLPEQQKSLNPKA